MAVIKVPTTFNIDLEFEVPEFYRRMISLFIDMLVQYIYIRIAMELYERITSNMGFSEDSWYDRSAIGLLLMVPVFIYHLFMEVTMNGQSIGKKIMGIRVVNENGGRPSIGQYLIRWLMRVSDLWMVVLIFFFLYVISTGGQDAQSTFILLATISFLVTDIVLVVSSKKNQRIGDILARTILIRTSHKADIEETVFQEVEEAYVPRYPQIMQLSDRDINSIKSILSTAQRKSDFAIASSAAQKVMQHLKIETTQEPFEFLETLLKDYNFLSTK